MGGLVAAAAFNRVFGEPQGEPLLRFGFTSDPHLCLMTPPTEKALEKALDEFARRNVDAVVISGDLCDMGTAEEMEMFLRLWEKAFPGEVFGRSVASPSLARIGDTRRRRRRG